VRIDGQRIRKLNASDQVAASVGENRCTAIGAIDMQPEIVLFRMLAAYMKRNLRRSGFTTVERVYGNLQSGEMSEEYFLYLLKQLKTDANEIYFHPAYFENEKLLTQEQKQCAHEFEALTSGKVKADISNSNIRLTNYIELEQP
jgi:hypothetical protein